MCLQCVIICAMPGLLNMLCKTMWVDASQLFSCIQCPFLQGISLVE